MSPASAVLPPLELPPLELPPVLLLLPVLLPEEPPFVVAAVDVLPTIKAHGS